MEGKGKNNGILVGFLLGIIVMLLVFGGLCLTNVVGFNKSINNNTVESGTVEETELLSNDEAINVGKKLYDKAVEMQTISATRPYCGYSDEEIANKKITNFGLSNTHLSYYETDYKNLDELKENLKKYFTETIIFGFLKDSVPVTNINDLENEGSEYEFFVIYNGKLYCRQHSGKGYLHYYIGEYDMTVEKIEANKITYNIKSAYVKDGINNKRCFPGDTKNCTEEDKEYKDTRFIIEKNNDNWVVSEYTTFGFDANDNNVVVFK